MIDPRKCINYMGISSGPDEWKYGLHPEHVRGGWPWRVQHMRTVAGMGCTRHLLHMPLGRDPDYQVDMASRLAADPDPAYGKLVVNFARDLKPLLREGNAIDVYLGFLQGSRGLEALKAPGKWDDYLRRLATTFKPFLDLGCGTIYFDCSCLVTIDMIEYDIFEMLRHIVGVGIESWPVNAPQYAGWPVCIENGTYKSQITYPGALPVAKAGPVVRLLDHTPDSEKVAAYEGIVADGHVPAVDLLNLDRGLVGSGA